MRPYSGLIAWLILTSNLAAHKDSIKKQYIHLSSYDISMKFTGEIKDDFFYYNRVRTFRNDYHDESDFIRHQLDVSWTTKQGEQRYGKPVSQSAITLTNYVYWQQNSVYMPFSTTDIRAQNLDNVIVAPDVTVKTLMPLIFIQEGWFKLHLDTITNFLKNNPTSLQVGFFNYIVGRGVSLGYHADLAVEYLGWPIDGESSRYPYMPPGVLLRGQIFKNCTADLYYAKWKELNATLRSTNEPTRAQRLDTTDPRRGKNKDSDNFVIKFDYKPKDTEMGDIHLQPYWVYTRSPEQAIETIADSSANLHTLGLMTDCTFNNFNVNIECAGQFGHQEIYPLDRNTITLNRSRSTGVVSENFSHIVYANTTGSGSVASYDRVPVSSPINPTSTGADFIPKEDLRYIVNLPVNRSLSQQGVTIKNAEGTSNIEVKKSKSNSSIYNANTFGNARFRNPYRLNYKGFMALADISYTFENHPFKLATCVGHISGDGYPYNEEKSRDYRGFVPMRSLYEGHAIKNVLLFDRTVIPRPLNISNRTLYAYNNVNDLSNLEFMGFGLTWYPIKPKDKLSLTAETMFLWEAAQLQKWDPLGHHSDVSSEKDIALERARLGFPNVKREYKSGTPPSPQENSGWVSNSNAHRMLGTEIDLKANYFIVKHCKASATCCFFIPGSLYRDLYGQPNIISQYVDQQGLSHYDSLGKKWAFAFILGLDYRF